MSDTVSTSSETGGAETGDARAHLLHRARNYPYAAPEHSYIYTAEGIRAFDPDARAGRTPVLAIGSNRAPERLKQKFGHDPAHSIPVQRARLHNFDVVFSAHITSYGAVPAMLQVSPGTAVEIWVTWLSDDQLPVMHETELGAANYHYAELAGVKLQMEDGKVERSAFAYISQRGHMVHEGRALALADVPAAGRRYAAATTGEALEHVRARVGAHDHVSDDWIARLVEDPAYRRGVTDTIAADCIAMQHPFRIIE
ncbi:hypothetical protein KAJ83_05725 [Marivibrio halodurans]|uniref:Uncharacterized protein n=1 Tax=Marivibrio halodurans TaxID=2039722 RepID=A0A8J7S0P0_9PROT|nr:hypothetical protein [Marivibrio halodurans]MBP5856498.1 hypothetical protein [Marivibrio halodurans]